MLNGKILSIAFASAASESGKLLIGKDNDLPGWQGQVPSDMSRFVRLTSYHTVIPGRKTWDSLPIAIRPLKNRQTVIMTRDRSFRPKFDLKKLVPNTEVTVAHSLEEALALAKSETVWIIGGSEIYTLALPHADYLHRTDIRGRFEGDTYFPELDWKEWRKIGEEHCTAGISGNNTKKDELCSSYFAFERIW